MYVIQREDGAFVAPSGSRASYTWYLQDAQVWPTREAAQPELCPGNERIVAVSEVMGRRQ